MATDRNGGKGERKSKCRQRGTEPREEVKRYRGTHPAPRRAARGGEDRPVQGGFREFPEGFS